MTLDEIGLKHGTDKASNGHDYLRLYEWCFGQVRDKPLRLLEIGVQFGNSLRTWQQYFSQAKIIGVDTIENNVCDFPVLIGNAYTKEVFCYLEVTTREGFDIIIDDGSHSASDQMWFVKNYASLLTEKGVLIVEDIVLSDFLPVLAAALPEGFYHGSADLRKPGGLLDSILFMAWRRQ